MRILLVVALGLSALGCGAEDESATAGFDPCWCNFRDDSRNPLIEAPSTNVIGDPTYLRPEEAPDGLWHLFAYTPAGIYGFRSENGIHWTPDDAPIALGFRPFVFVDAGSYHLFYQRYDTPQSSHLEVIVSQDLVTWTPPDSVLPTSLPFEKELSQGVVSNPFVERRDAEYWLYYSADQGLLKDSGVYEPRHLSFATASELHGPYTKHGTPIWSPSDADPSFNLGIGSLKVFAEPWQGKRIAFANGLYAEPDGTTHSAIHLVASEDGVSWQKLCSEPILAPSGKADWKRAYVYAFDAKRVKNEIWLYYNARDGWAAATERLGLARLRLSENLDDMAVCGAN